MLSHVDDTSCMSAAQVARRKGSDGKLLSMGYGFIETDSEGVAQAVIKQLQVRRGMLLVLAPASRS